MNNYLNYDETTMQAALREYAYDAEDDTTGVQDDVPKEAYENVAFVPTEEDMAQLREEMMASMMDTECAKPSVPDWVTKMGVHEHRFVKAFLHAYPMRYWNGCFYGEDGRVETEQVMQWIVTMILPYVSRNIEKTVGNLMGVLKLYAKVNPPKPDVQNIPVANGTLRIWESAHDEDPSAGAHHGVHQHSCDDNTYLIQLDPKKEIVPYRLPVEFHETVAKPLHWLDFLDMLLEPEDIDTLQEYLGYLLIPTTKAQKMLCLIGRGGEGKSVIGGVLKTILGDGLWFSSIQKIESNRFARADLVGRLCMVDDDMQLNALSSTGILKSMVTNQGKFDVERKGRQSTQEEMYCRFLCFGNGALTALYDRTDGFYRRQIVLRTKPKDKRRVDDPWLIEKLIAEREGIFLWMIAGLLRLLEQNFRFSISDKTKINLRETYVEGNNMEEFLRDTTRLTYGAEEQITSRRLCLIYRKWCEDNGLRASGDQYFLTWVKENADRFGICFKKNIMEDSFYYRGFVGVSGRLV